MQNQNRIKAVATTQIYKNKNQSEDIREKYDALIYVQAEQTNECTFYKYRLRLEDELMVAEPQHSDIRIAGEPDTQAHFLTLQSAFQDFKRRRDGRMELANPYYGGNLTIVSACKEFLQWLGIMINGPKRAVDVAPSFFDVLREFERIQTVLIGKEDAESVLNAEAFLIE